MKSGILLTSQARSSGRPPAPQIFPSEGAMFLADSPQVLRRFFDSSRHLEE